MKLYYYTIILILFTVIVAGCSSNTQDTETSAELKIYTSVYPIQFAVEQIGGESVTAESVYPPGVDAHTYEPSSKDITSIAEGDAFIFLGAGLEGFAETAADALASQEVSLIEIGANESLFHDSGNSSEHSHDHKSEDGHHHDHNPHVWLDPIRMIDMAEIIKKQLSELNPEDTEQYNSNFNSLKNDLLELDKKFQETLKSKVSKKIVVSHAAYGYWEQRYNIEQIAINGLSSNDEPSQKELTAIIDQTKEHDIDYILFEQNSSDRITEIIQEQIGAKSLRIHNLATRTESDITRGDDYISLMEKNLEVLDQATTRRDE
ncbi:zinc transport system substrate-binding protein [Lentibacillus persicus]|uniref:Zinc transport system substrate-binding protein n=1 Tax=Lentibacillus persicus TaxID=640948 RepID=A0A1I1WP76_9BACI|nr:zinc ABC transporter substrate-binding protein [Lentibacillus persicus]SFD95223.1 zinc transport system substrate-binding protein [Lentibacillus persicus]